MPTGQVTTMVVKTARKLVIFVIGGTALLLGIVMLVMPGPGIAGIVAGLAILGTEFVWAKLLLKRMSDGAAKLASQAGFRPKKR